MPVSAVAFDLDYTLAVPSESRAEILAATTDATDVEPIEREAYLDAHRRNLTRETREPIFDELLADRGSDTDPELVAREYRERIAAALRPIDGAEALVERLRERYAVGLLTDGPVRAQRDKLATLGWTELFDAALVSGELPAGKPDERAFAALADALDVPASEIVYVGDNPDADIDGAADAGLFAVQVTFDGGPEPNPRADARVERDRLVERLPALVERLD